MRAQEKARPVGSGTGEAQTAGGLDEHGQSTAAVPCRPDCALRCDVDPLRRYLADTDGMLAPAWQRLGWTLVGVPDPLPADRWREAVGIVEAAHGPQTAARGLAWAAGQPPMRGWTSEARDAAAALAATYRRQAAA